MKGETCFQLCSEYSFLKGPVLMVPLPARAVVLHEQSCI